MWRRCSHAETYHEEVARHVTKTVTLNEPEFAGRWDVEPLADGRLLLSPHVGPTIVEIEAEYGERLQGEEFERRWGHLRRVPPPAPPRRARPS